MTYSILALGTWDKSQDFEQSNIVSQNSFCRDPDKRRQYSKRRVVNFLSRRIPKPTNSISMYEDGVQRQIFSKPQTNDLVRNRNLDLNTYEVEAGMALKINSALCGAAVLVSRAITKRVISELGSLSMNISAVEIEPYYRSVTFQNHEKHFKW